MSKILYEVDNKRFESLVEATYYLKEKDSTREVYIVKIDYDITIPTNLVNILGVFNSLEILNKALFDIELMAEKALKELKEIGFDCSVKGFKYNEVEEFCLFKLESMIKEDINKVTKGEE